MATATTTTTTLRNDTKIHPPMVPTSASKIPPSYRPRKRNPDGSLTPTVTTSATITPTVNGGMPQGTQDRIRARAPSHLRNEVQRVNPVAIKLGTDVVKLLAALPAPLPLALPPRFLSSRGRSPTRTSFTEFAAASKRRSPSNDEPLIGLGLTLEPSKRQKQQNNDDFSGVLSRMGTRKHAGPSKVGWTSAQWSDKHHHVSKQAILAKRYGDAYGLTNSAREEFIKKVSYDATMSLLKFTDSVLLFLYSYWCMEQGAGRLRPADYLSSDRFRADIRGHWEREYRRDNLCAEEKGRIGCMVGLMHLVEAMIANHLSHSRGTQVQQQHREISIAASLASSSTPKSGNDRAPIPSTIGPSPNYISPHGQQDRSPSNNSNEGAMELANLANELAGSMNLAANHLHISRSRLTPIGMRDYFPRMFENAMTSDFSAEAVPAPGDMLGSGRTVDPDNTDHFAWPIELGMSAGIAHLVAFGRGMAREYAESCGYDWQTKLE